MRLNGWDLDEFQATVDEVDANPEAGKLTWRTRVDWDEGFGVDARPREIEQLGEVMRRRFTLRGDHPPDLLGENTGPTAVEALLAALGSCIAGTYAAHATAKGVELEALEVELEGRIDLNGFLQLQEIPAGLDGVTVTIRVRSDAESEVLEEIEDVVTRASPVYSTVSRPTAIRSSVERMA